MADSPLVYFVEAISLDLVKIGWTTDLDTRWYALRKANACELRLLGTTPGGRTVETALHARFVEYRVRGEWFRLSPIRSELESLGEVVTVHACADCRAPLKRRRNARCRSCAMKRVALRARAVELQPPPQTFPCGGGCGRTVRNACAQEQGHRQRVLCRSCAIRLAWSTDEYRGSIMKARMARRRVCKACGLSEPRLGKQAKYHPECWDRVQQDLRMRTPDAV